jgi:uncharacterized protein YndB with AHSA1/START domain
MATIEKTNLKVGVTVNAPVETVWKLWNDPKHIVHWNTASDDWHTPKAENDLRVGGKIMSRMEAKDGSMGFDFVGVYSKIEPLRQIEYTIGDGREVRITFASEGAKTTVTEIFEAEQMNSLEMQQSGWQSILDNFKKYAETSSELNRLHFEITIGAKVKKVFSTMIDEQHYREWTAAFNPTSHFKGSWEKGAKIIFLGTDQDGKEGGMIGKIKENIPNQFLSIEYTGIVQNGKEITTGADIEGWAGACENYTFTERNGKTLLAVDLDSNQEFMNYFTETWPKALNILKAICER